MPGIPPLKISTTDNSFTQIPVFELELSGGTLTKLSPTKVRLQIGGSQGPSGPPGASTVYAPTGGEYITFVANNTLTAEKVLTASDNITVTTDASTFWIAANTSDISGKQDSVSFPLNIGSGGTGKSTTGAYATLLGISNGAYEPFSIIASNNIVVRSDATNIYLEAQTSSAAAGVTYAPTGGFYAVFSAQDVLTSEKVITASNNITITTDGSSIYFSANTNASSGTAGLVGTGRTLTASSGLTGGGDLSADRIFSVNTNVRDKSVGLFVAGNFADGS